MIKKILIEKNIMWTDFSSEYYVNFRNERQVLLVPSFFCFLHVCEFLLLSLMLCCSILGRWFTEEKKKEEEEEEEEEEEKRRKKEEEEEEEKEDVVKKR